MAGVARAGAAVLGSGPRQRSSAARRRGGAAWAARSAERELVLTAPHGQTTATLALRDDGTLEVRIAGTLVRAGTRTSGPASSAEVALRGEVAFVPGRRDPPDAFRSAAGPEVRVLKDGRVVACLGGPVARPLTPCGGRDSARPPARRVVDARGKFVVPGLTDMHVHFGGGPALVAENRALLALYVAHGVTTVRDAAADLSDVVLAWRDSIARGALRGPTLFTSGPKLEGINSVWPGDLEVGSREAVDAALDSLTKPRVDFVKLTDNTLDPGLFLYALGEIRKRELRSSAHVPQPVAVRDAVEAGLGSVEHLAYAIKAGSPREAELSRARAEGRLPSRVPPEDAVARWDSATAVATYRLMARRGTAVTPTLLISRTLAYLDRDPLRDIRATRAIHAVVLRGAYLDRPALDAMLGEVERAVR